MGIKQKEEHSSGGLHNALAAGTIIKGNIITETDFRLDGTEEGDIASRQLEIEPNAQLNGTCRMENPVKA